MKRPLNQLRFTVGALALLIVSSVVILSCQDEGVKSPGPESQQDENRSEISIIEEKTGITYYKQDLTLSDESGENKVTLRVAGQDEEMVKEYLKSRIFSITPLYAHEKKESIKLPYQPNPQPGVASAEKEYESTVIIEVVSQTLKKGVLGVGFRDQPNPAYEVDKSGRTNYYEYREHVSNNWPSWLSLQAYQYVEFMIWYKGRWYQSWTPWYGPETWCCYDFDEFNVDGPYRVSLRIQYNYEGDYYYEFFY
jgi:hypothetical protein